MSKSPETAQVRQSIQGEETEQQRHRYGDAQPSECGTANSDPSMSSHGRERYHAGDKSDEPENDGGGAERLAEGGQR